MKQYKIYSKSGYWLDTVTAQNRNNALNTMAQNFGALSFNDLLETRPELQLKETEIIMYEVSTDIISTIPEHIEL